MEPYHAKYYVVRRTLRKDEELSPFKDGGITQISEPVLIHELSYSWNGRGNEGEGTWVLDPYGDTKCCELVFRGTSNTITVKGGLNELGEHLHATYADAVKEMRGFYFTPGKKK